MVAPVVGPVAKPTVTLTYKNPNGTTITTLTRTRTGSRQKRPYNLPLIASMTERKARSGPRYSTLPGYVISTTDDAADTRVWIPGRAPFDSMPSDVYNKAYARLKDLLLGDAALGINAVQRAQAFGMMADRVSQLYSFTRHLRRFEFGKAADDLGISRGRLKNFTLRKESKALGNNWLEYHFGWSPLIHDIHKAIDLNQNPIPDVFLRTSATDHRSRLTMTVVDALQTKSELWDARYKVKLGTHVIVTNPNLWLANKMGLVNPAVVIWDSVPFSFVVDWFVTLNDVMSSWSDFAGLTLVNPWNTVFYVSRYTLDTRTKLSPTVTQVAYAGQTRTSFNRTLGIGSGPTLKVRKPWTVSSTRGATAVALLVQALR